MTQAVKSQRASERIMLKLTPDERAGLDRLAGRMGVPRSTAVKRLMALMVAKSDREVDGSVVSAG